MTYITLEQQARNLYDDIDKAYRFQDWDAHEVIVPMLVEALKEAQQFQLYFSSQRYFDTANEIYTSHLTAMMKKQGEK